MQVINWDQFLKTGLASNIKEKKTSMTVGVFDGVHLGHQALIKRVVSHNADYAPVVITFRQNHKTEKAAYRKQNEKSAELADIQNFRQRLEMFEKLGIMAVIVIDFTEDFSRMSGIEFLELLLKHGNVGFFSAGNNFRCGHKLDTNAEKIKSFFTAHNIPVEIVLEVMEGSIPISSSRIRTAIAAGDLQLAQKMLGAV